MKQVRTIIRIKETKSYQGVVYTRRLPPTNEDIIFVTSEEIRSFQPIEKTKQVGALTYRKNEACRSLNLY